MVLAIADEHRTVSVNEHPMGTGKAGLLRIAWLAVAWLTGAGNQFDRAAFDIEATDGVVLCVGDVNVTVGGDGDPFRSVQRRFFCRSTIAGEPFFASACRM